ncbi:ribulokinase [Mucilaginibacter sp.]
MNSTPLVIGVDYGTDSVRSVIADTADGKELAASVYTYPRWKKGLYCDAGLNQFRQHPADYLEGLERTITDCIQKAGGAGIAERIKGISIDTTGSTPAPVNKAGVPLALLPGFEENPNAMFILWKDHTAIPEAAEINDHNASSATDYLKYVGGIYSSEWFWAKLLHVLRTDEQVRQACYSWVEHCDWISYLLTGGTDIDQMKRSRCAAGHKALWAEEFGGLPPDDFFSAIDPLLQGFTGRLFKDTYTADVPAGKLCTEWAGKLGLSEDVIIGVGAIDAHMGAVGGQIEPYYLSKVMGTSTCDMLVVPPADLQNKQVKGICGQVNGSIIPGMIGLEAGQSAFGDTYAWFKQLLSWPLQQLLHKTQLIDQATTAALIEEMEDQLLPELNRQAAALPPDAATELAMDWFNGRRTPDANQELKGAITGLNLGTDAPRLFRALAEATCFGAKSIVERFIAEGIPVKGVIGIGGVAKKSPFIMQMMADVLGMPIRVHEFEHTCALGAAMFAATAAGIYPDTEAAMKAMGRGFGIAYQPNPEAAPVYAQRYLQYQNLGHYIDEHTAPMNADEPRQ